MPIRLVYTSTLKPIMTEPLIKDLIDKAADFNRQQDITGVLAVEGLRVCQILEGPANAVQNLFASIRRDSRHSAVNELEQREIKAHYFKSWGMVRRPMVDIVTLAFSI